MLGIGVKTKEVLPLESTIEPIVPSPTELSKFAYSTKNESYGLDASTKLSTTIASDNWILSLVVSVTWMIKYAPSASPLNSEIVVNPGDPEAVIEVVLASIVDLWRLIVPIPVEEWVASPTVIVLITPVVAIPTAGAKSTLSWESSMYGRYVPNPEEASPSKPCVVNLPNSRSSKWDP